MCTLWISLFLCTSEAYSQYVFAYFDLYDDSTSTWYHDAIRSVYDVPSAMRDFIRQTLKPFLRPEWLEEPSIATATKHMANYLHYMIQRVYDAACFMQGEDLEDHIRSVPTALFRELEKAFESGNYAVLRRFSDPGADRTACLFGVYHLACQKTLWMSSLLGSTFLTAQLYHTPLRYRIQQLYTKKTVDEAQFARFRPAFSLFDLPQSSDSSAPSDTEQARMQQLLFFLGLRFYDREETESVRAQAESLFRDCLTVYEPTSDLEAGAIAATSFLSLQMQSGSVYRIAAVKALSESTVDQMYLQWSHDSLQQRAYQQQTYADGLTRANTVLENENAKLRQQIADLDADKEDLKRQINQLLDLLDKTDEEETPVEAEFSFPADISPHTAYVFGGHTNFQSELRKLIPGLRMAEVDQRVDKQAIANADVVYLQAAHISHSTFYTVMGVCKTNHVPVVYLTSTSAKRAAVQIVKDIGIRVEA